MRESLATIKIYRDRGARKQKKVIKGELKNNGRARLNREDFPPKRKGRLTVLDSCKVKIRTEIIASIF